MCAPGSSLRSSWLVANIQGPVWLLCSQPPGRDYGMHSVVYALPHYATPQEDYGIGKVNSEYKDQVKYESDWVHRVPPDKSIKIVNNKQFSEKIYWDVEKIQVTGDWHSRSRKTCWCSYPNKRDPIRKSGIFYFLLSPNLILCLGSTSPHVWQEMKSQSGTGARTHLIERKPRCEFLSRLYLDTTIFSGIIPWFEQNLKNINISDTNGGLGLNPNWKRGRDQIKKDWKNILIMVLVFLSVFDGHFRLFCHWVMTAELAGPVVSPRPLPFLDYDETKISRYGVLWWCPTSIQFNQNCRRNNWSIIRRLNCQVVNMVLNNVTTSATFDVTRTRHQPAAASICSDVHPDSFELL